MQQSSRHRLPACLPILQAHPATQRTLRSLSLRRYSVLAADMVQRWVRAGSALTARFTAASAAGGRASVGVGVSM